MGFRVNLTPFTNMNHPKPSCVLIITFFACQLFIVKAQGIVLPKFPLIGTVLIGECIYVYVHKYNSDTGNYSSNIIKNKDNSISNTYKKYMYT